MKTLTKKIIFLGFISVLLFGNILSSISMPTQTKDSSKNITLSSDDFSFNKIKLSSVPYSNITIVSDGYEDHWGWNSGQSELVSITNDDFGNIHAVWSDGTNGKWKYDSNDYEIMYAKWTAITGWSNATVISDGYGDKYWNSGNSQNPSIAADHFGNLYVAWYDDTNNNAKWGTDLEIMFANWTIATGEWSNASVISDGYKSQYWNNGQSLSPSIDVDDSGNVYIVWEDNSTGKWKYNNADWEIMIANWTAATGKWSNASVISDGFMDKYWNTDRSGYPSIAVESSGNVHVVWYDDTSNQAKWKTDSEIMYVNWNPETSWSNATVISDGYKGIWNNRNSGNSQDPSITVDGIGNIYVVWEDITSGIWTDGAVEWEIMFANWTVATNEWSNFSVISDGYQGKWGWNNGTSQNPSIAVDSFGNVHVAWQDDTNNIARWGIDYEIMYTKWTTSTGWSNASVISDGYNNIWGWNNESSQNPSIAADSFGNVLVAWEDNTNNIARWGIDKEIMCSIIPIITSQLLIGGDDDDDDNGGIKKGLIIYGYDIILLMTAISSISIIYLRKKYKKYKNNFISN